MKYKVIECAIADLEEELNKEENAEYEVVSVAYKSTTQVCAVLIKRFY